MITNRIILATALVTFATAALALYASWRNGQEIQEIHISINSRMDELLALTKKAAHAAGKKEERDNPSDQSQPQDVPR